MDFNLEEIELIIALKSGQESAYALLVKQLSQKVYHTCLGLVQNEQDAEDITQEVFVGIYQSIHQFKEESKLSTWVYRISVTKSLEFLRAKNRKKRFAFVQSLFSNDNELKTDVGHFYHPGIQLENKERAAILFAAIDKLSENQKTAFVLSKLENLSYVEIAEVMNLSVSSVESLLFRAKQNLQSLLGDYYEKNEK